MNWADPATTRFLEFEINNGMFYDIGQPVDLSIVPDSDIDDIIKHLHVQIEYVQGMNLYTVEMDEEVRHQRARIDRFTEYKKWRNDHGYHP